MTTIQPTHFLSLPKELIGETLSYLDLPSLCHFALASRKCRQHADNAILASAKTFGYEGEDTVDLAKNYFQVLLQETEKLPAYRYPLITRHLCYTSSSSSSEGAKLKRNAILCTLSVLSINQTFQVLKLLSQKPHFPHPNGPGVQNIDPSPTTLPPQPLLPCLGQLMLKKCAHRIAKIDGEVGQQIKNQCLLLAIFYQHVATTNLLLSNGADANAFFNGLSLLQYAVQMRSVHIAQLLIEAHAHVDAVTPHNRSTALFYACEYAQKEINPELIALLLAAGADPNLRGGIANDTPLLRVVEKCSAESVRLLVNAHADVNASAHDGETPLMMACLQYPRPLEIINFLIDSHADPKIANNTGQTAVQIAEQLGIDLRQKT